MRSVLLYIIHTPYSAVKISSAQEKRRTACAAAADQVLHEQREHQKELETEKVEEGMPNGNKKTA
jgi:hypothetical protein